MPVTPLAQVLPSAVAEVRRGLTRDGDGRLVEVVELPEGRAARLPRGGVFAPFAVVAAFGPDAASTAPRITLGPPLAYRLGDLAPTPLVVLGLAARVLADLAVFHGEGGTHGALAAEGWGFDAGGVLRVRPCLHVKQRPGAPSQVDVAAVGAVVVALAPGLAAPGGGELERAPLWLRGMGVGTDRVGFLDARAAGQALAAVVRNERVDEALQAFLARVGGRLPPAAMWFGARPEAEAVGAEARAWVREELDRMRREPSGSARPSAVDEARQAAEREARAVAERREVEARVEAERVARALADREAAERRKSELRAEAERVAAWEVAAEQARIAAERFAIPEADCITDEAERAIPAPGRLRTPAAAPPPREPAQGFLTPGGGTPPPPASVEPSFAPESAPPPPTAAVAAADGPRWEGVAGVTGDRAREGEKGPGKWVEQGRSLSELTADLPEGGPRPVDLGPASRPPRSPVGYVIIGIIVLVGLAAAWWWR